MSTMPTRIDEDLFEAAKASGAVLSRSAAQQITHWARLGRELEASGNVSAKDVERVLSGHAPYDSLSAASQAAVRTAWDERIEVARETLDLEAEFTAADESWSELAEDGTVVIRRGTHHQ